MKKRDALWIIVIAGLFAFIAVPQTRDLFIGFTSAHPYIGGFLKFAVLATLGELLAIRLTAKDWIMPKGLGFRMLIWGFIGMVIVLVFGVYAAGVTSAMDKGLLPGKGLPLAFAFFTSVIMNLTFAPVMMFFHRLTDTYIDLKYSKKLKIIKMKDLINQVDWREFYAFVICKTIPFLWIPAHTLTFMLPPEYRVLMAAVLSLVLGLILTFAKKRSASR